MARKMNTVSNTRTIWPLGMAIRPVVDRESDRVEVTDTVTGRRFSWSPDVLADYILRYPDPRTRLNGNSGLWPDAVAAQRDRTVLAPGWQHWRERGWHPSDEYYVASRRWRYVDLDDADGAIRTKVLNSFLEVDGPPPDEVLPDGQTFALGDPMRPPEQGISDLLVHRRSGRAYAPRSVALSRLSGLLWYGLSRVRAKRERIDESNPLSYLDSFGAAWDFHLCVYAVEGVAPGTYRYDILNHELIEVRHGDHRRAMADILQGMKSPATAAWTLGLVADFPRYQWRYRHEHGLRRLYIEAGIIGQELIILGGSYGLSTLATPAQKDTPYLALHGLPNDRYAPVYTLTMGLTRGSIGIHFGPEFADVTGEL